MLLIENLDDLEDAVLKQLLMDFRKVQVSRYPLKTKYTKNSNVMGFVDSRFETDRFTKENMPAMIWWEEKDGKIQYTVESRLIQNDKYAAYNDDYHTRRTSDPKKLFKYMKEYVKPFTAQEIANRTLKQADQAFDAWQSDMYRNVRRTVNNIDFDDILEEVCRLKAIGVQPQTERFKNVYDKGVEAYQSYKEIRNKKFSRIHVFICNDDSVTITTLPNAPSKDSGVQIYESIDKSPTYIQEQVGMLRMMDAGKMVPHVGFKASDKEFWIEGLSQ